MKLLTMDFETYFDDTFSLRKITPENYIRDARYKTHCLGVKQDANGAIGLCGSVLNRLQSRQIDNFAVLCHNTPFDGLILTHHYKLNAGHWFDTLAMARHSLPHLKSHSLDALATFYGLSPKTVPYSLFKGVRDISPGLMAQLVAGCCHDVDLTHAIFLRLAGGFPREELQVIDLTTRLFTSPALRLDRLRLGDYLAKTRDDKARLFDRLGVAPADLHSAEKFADLLRGQGVEPPIKISPRTGLPAYAFAKTDEGMKELAEADNPTIQALVAARLGAKSTIDETRSQRLLDMDNRGPLCVPLKYAGAHTLRWSGDGKVNFQNFRRGGEVRKSILAPEGMVIVVGDLGQIECRLLNWLAGEDWVLEAFREKRDLYSEGASVFYHRAITKTDKLERHLGKTIELGCGFGMGHVKFRATCRGGAMGGPPIILSEAEAKSAVNIYRGSHPCVVRYWKAAEGVLQQIYAGGWHFSWGPFVVDDKRIILPNGSWLDYSHVGYDGKEFYTEGRRGRSKIYGALLVENVVQALARLVLAQAMLKIRKRYQIVMMTHDEVAALAPEAEATEALEFILAELCRTPVWADNKLPLEAEGGYAREYSK